MKYRVKFDLLILMHTLVTLLAVREHFELGDFFFRLTRQYIFYLLMNKNIYYFSYITSHNSEKTVIPLEDFSSTY